MAAGRIGRGTKFPPQFGHAPPKIVSVQVAQNVHSKVQIIASRLSGGRSLSQHSQFGLSFIIGSLLRTVSDAKAPVAPTQPINRRQRQHHHNSLADDLACEKFETAEGEPQEQQ